MRRVSRVDRRGRRAFTLVELAVSLAVLSLVLLGFAATSATSARQRELAEQQRRAEQALAAWVAELEALPLPAVVGAAAAPPTDPVPGLQGVVRDLVVYTDEPGPSDPAERAALAFPIDINGDGDQVDVGVAPAAAALLPARVRLRWTSPGSPRELEVGMYVYFSTF